jgi:hypothetical protein
MPAKKRPQDDPIAAIQAAAEQAYLDRWRRLVELVSPDRRAVRPSLAVLAVDPGRKTINLKSGHTFTVAGDHGEIEFATVRDETLPAVQIAGIEPVAGLRPAVGRGEMSGLRLQVRRLGDEPLAALRLHIADPAMFAEVLRSAEVYLRSESGFQRVAATAAGIESGPDLYPTPRLGSAARSLLAAFFHAPLALSFLDLQFTDPGSDLLDFLLLFDDPAAAPRLDPQTIRTGAIAVVNRRLNSVNVTVEPTQAFEPVPVPDGHEVVEVAQVQAFRGKGQWVECRPWLGSRHSWKHRSTTGSQYVTSHVPGRLSIGLVEPGRGLDATGTNLNVRVVLASPAASLLPAGTPVVGDRGEKASLAVESSRLLLPAEIEPPELEAEFRANTWLTRGRGDATAGLRALLDQAAGGSLDVSQRPAKPRGQAAMAAIERVTLAASAADARLPVLDVVVETVSAVEPHLFLLLATLERALPLLAPPLTATRLVHRTPEGERSWTPRAA